jgi:acyl-coenzyme A thioesterase PaaI-like protein
MSSLDHFRRLERMYASAPINAYFAPHLTVSEGRAEVSIPVRPEFFHAAHAVHGSVYFKALDDAAFFAVNSLVNDVFVLTVTYNVYLTRPVTSGVMSVLCPPNF